jgi:hypothetical protein
VIAAKLPVEVPQGGFEPPTASDNSVHKRYISDTRLTQKLAVGRVLPEASQHHHDISAYKNNTFLRAGHVNCAPQWRPCTAGDSYAATPLAPTVAARAPLASASTPRCTAVFVTTVHCKASLQKKVSRIGGFDYALARPDSRFLWEATCVKIKAAWSQRASSRGRRIFTQGGAWAHSRSLL